MRARALLVAVALALAVACSAGSPDEDATGAASPTAKASASADPPRPGSSQTPAKPSATVVAAGDIACRNGCADKATAGVVAAMRPRLVLALGDLQYETGAYDEFRRDYDRSWGRFKAITRPVPGNHEYAGGRAPGYYRYFGAAAGHPGRGWYSFDVDDWHLVALNSNCGGAGVGGCGPGSPQVRWLAADLAASRARCTLAYWHQPRFSSGLHGSDSAYDAFWRTLHAARAEVVLSGHDHHYERFAPLDPAQQPDPNRGVRQLVVGTGGKTLYPVFFSERGSEVRNDTAHGVLRLTLRTDSYEWRFVTISGRTADTGAGQCH